MTAQELKEMCERWDKSPEQFAEIVRNSVAMGVYQRELATEFEVAVSTVSRWASGIAKPHPRMQKLIISALEKRARSRVSGPGSASGGVPRPIPLAARGR